MSQTFAFMDVDAGSVDYMLAKLMLLLSPQGLTTFLGSTVGPYLARRAGERFENEGDDVVGKWAELKPATMAIRAEGPWAVGPDHPINRRTGELENWVVRGGWHAYPEGFGAAMQYPASLPTGELYDKVKTAQSGRSEPNTVPRPVLGLNEADMLFVITAFAANIEAID